MQCCTLVGLKESIPYTHLALTDFAQFPLICMLQTDREIQSIVMRDVTAREQATKHFFKKAMQSAVEG